MKKYLVLSLLVHLLFCLPLLSFKANKKQKIEFTLDEPGPEQKRADKGANEQIKPLGEDDGEESKNFYWGLGISCRFIVIQADPACIISEIASGYAAANSSLQIMDIIYAIDNKPLVNGNDLRGEKPRKMYLTFLRKGVTMNLVIERVKVYY